jgi:hypothetical protein
MSRESLVEPRKLAVWMKGILVVFYGCCDTPAVVQLRCQSSAPAHERCCFGKSDLAEFPCAYVFKICSPSYTKSLAIHQRCNYVLVPSFLFCRLQLSNRGELWYNLHFPPHTTFSFESKCVSLDIHDCRSLCITRRYIIIWGCSKRRVCEGRQSSAATTKADPTVCTKPGPLL